MTGFPFVFTFDASGSPDDIILPQDLPLGTRTVVLRPPVGHAWTYYGEGPTGLSLPPDEPVVLRREVGQGPFQPRETVGRAALDTGSGNGQGLAS